MFTKNNVSQSMLDAVNQILKEDDCVTPMQSKKIADKEVDKHEKSMHKGKKPTFEDKKMEEDKLKETGFHMAAHAAKKAGQPHFTFQGKKYPTTAKSTAESMDEASVFDYKANKDEKDPKFTTKKPGERTGHDSKKTEKGVQYTKKPLRSDGQEFKKEEVEMDFKERLLEKNWIAGAIKKPGAETAAAKKAGMSVQDYAQKHKHDAGKAGKRARLAITLKGLHKEAKDHEYSDPHMAVNQLRTIMTNTEELLGMLGDTTDLPEWVESKITLAEDYIMTVANYMRSELHEDVELDEANKESKKDFDARQARLAAASKETAKDPMRLKRLSSIPGYTAAMNLAKKTTKEDVEGVDEVFRVNSVNAQQARSGQDYHYNQLKTKADAGDEDSKKRLALIDKTREAKRKAFDARMDEGMMDTMKKAGHKVLKTLGHGSDADMIKDLAKKTGVNPPPKPKKEAVDRGQATTDTLAGRVKGGKDNEHSSIKVKLKNEAAEKDDKPPFDGPYTKVKDNVKDKSGAIHTPMSRAKHLAKTAMKKVKSEMMLGKAGGTSE